MQITDQISPYDLTEFLARDYDDIRMPVNAFKLRFPVLSVDIELIWLPIFQEGIMPGEDNPWALASPELSTFSDVSIIADPEPDKTIENSEFGGKVSLYLSGFDLSFSALHTWNDFPISNVQIFSDSISITSEYYRYSFIGIDLSTSLSDFILRGEAAYYIDNRFVTEQDIVKGNSINTLLGLDWYPGNDWTVSVQVADEFVIDYTNTMIVEEHQLLSTISISKELFRNTLSLSTFAYIGINEREIFNRSSVDYAITDALHILAGIDIIDGKSSGMFGQFKDNSEIWIKAKYSF